ncbi:DUF192 domain-containing protein [Maribacter antarcticus]|uniref:DUF192 domain-containing protein n=1 Tax=Maribacter antarcticus TaxID=505250 RepID=UPI00055A90CA|nr:DUF192 domain-containing protein [Maribacter antarcticus]
MSIKHSFSFFLVLVFLFSCKEENNKTIKTEEVIFSKEGTLQIFKKETDTLLINLNIEIAESDYETQTGLMYRNGMERNQAMLFIFPEVAIHSFYMKNTAFPLDIIFIDENQKIASLQENAEPFNQNGLSSQVPVKYVLEVNAGLTEDWFLEIGDRIVFKRE